MFGEPDGDDNGDAGCCFEKSMSPSTEHVLALHESDIDTYTCSFTLTNLIFTFHIISSLGKKIGLSTQIIQPVSATQSQCVAIKKPKIISMNQIACHGMLHTERAHSVALDQA